MSDRPLRVALWCAVSSVAQAGADKVSLPEQRRIGEEFAHSLNAQICGIYEVPGHSRDIIFFEDAAQQMPAYRDLRDDVLAGRLDVLHVVDPDRLGRDPALCQTVISMCEKNGCEVYFGSSPHVIGQKGQGARYVEAFMAVRAGEEQSIRVARHERGMRGRVRRGLHPNSWPYGYAVVRDATGSSIGAELVPEEAAAVRYITKRFLAGASFREIGHEVREADYPTQRGGKWSDRYIRSVLHNDTYAGYPTWANAQPDDVSTRYPHLWDASTFAAVVAERRRRGQRHYHATPLMDVAFCGRCGGRMSRSTYNGQYGSYIYLRCASHATRRDCHANHVHESDVRDAVTAFVADALSDPSEIERLAESRAGPQAGLERELEELDARLDDVAAQRQRLAHALAAGKMDVGMYRQTDDALLNVLDGVNAAWVQVEAQLEALPSAEQQIATMHHLLEGLDSLWERPPREVAALLQAVGVHVYVEEGEVAGCRWAVWWCGGQFDMLG